MGLRLCLTCGHENSVSLTGSTGCAVCGNFLKKGTLYPASPSLERKSYGGIVAWVGLAIVGISVLSVVAERQRTTDSSAPYQYTGSYSDVRPTSPPERRPYSPPTAPEPTLPPRQAIATGLIEYSGQGRRVAPLEIKVPYGIGHYVKLVNTRTGKSEVTAFIQGGDKLSLDMPLGAYELRYAMGTTWYGEEHLFGPTTGYARSAEHFYFTADADGYSGYTVELIKQLNGNLETDPISAADF